MVSEIDASMAEVGTPISLSFLAKGISSDPEFPDLTNYFGPHLQPLSLDHDSLEVAGEQLPRWTLKITAKEPLKTKLKSLEVIFQKDTLYTDAYELEFYLDSTFLSNKRVFLGLKPNFHPEYAFWEQVYRFRYAIGMLALAVLGLLFFFFRKSNSKKEEPKEKRKIIGSLNEALQAIDQLKNTDLSNQRAQYKYYSALSDIYKSYIFQTHRIPAYKMLRKELLKTLKEKDIHSIESLHCLETFLFEADMVKFAKEFIYEEKAKKRIEDLKALVTEAEPIAMETEEQ